MESYNLEVSLQIILAFLGFVGGVGSAIGAYIGHQLRQIRELLVKMEVNDAVIMERLDNSKIRQDALEKRIEKLEGDK